MGGSGRRIGFAELDDRSRRLAGVLDDLGLRRGDHLAVLMENHPAYYEVVWAGLRSGLYVTAVNSHLTAEEAAYIVDDCGAEVVVTTGALGASGRPAAEAHARGPPPPDARRRGRGPSRLRVPRRLSGRPDRSRRSAGDGDALLLGHHRPAQGDQVPAACARLPAGRVGDRRAQPAALRLRRGHGLPLTGPPLPRRPAAGLAGRAVRGRDGRGDGAVRPGGGAGPHRARAGHAQPVGADHVRPAAEAPRGRARPPRPLQPPAWRPTPPRRARWR